MTCTLFNTGFHDRFVQGSRAAALFDGGRQQDDHSRIGVDATKMLDRATPQSTPSNPGDRVGQACLAAGSRPSYRLLSALHSSVTPSWETLTRASASPEQQTQEQTAMGFLRVGGTKWDTTSNRRADYRDDSWYYELFL